MPQCHRKRGHAGAVHLGSAQVHDNTSGALGDQGFDSSQEQLATDRVQMPEDSELVTPAVGGDG
jgi:hypothetical protein